MVKRWFLVGVALLLVPLLIVGCGIPRETYEAVVAERNTAQGNLQSVSSELETKKTELQTTRSELENTRKELETTKTILQSVQNNLDTERQRLTSMQSDLSRVSSVSSSLKKKQALLKQVLAFDSASLRASRARTDQEQAEMEKQLLLALAAFKSYDPLVADIADPELSRIWGEVWPAGARTQSEQSKTVYYTFKAYANFLDRLAILLQNDIDKL